ncbi:energy transducer TonB family protein [Sedimentitalea todarodis]|uniref:TonB family protein n=1 Tax=Sedimentitalea todarodis TaxID=1631240 RepID=A0ABU3VED3_9RHOB|nr:TonB family protein [Sedimentitalea todarodis]MDU9004533.1 TonB family protein [Sedimentitalea todarodis]
MIRRSAGIATAAVLLSLLVHFLGLALTSGRATGPSVEDSSTDAVALGNAFEDVAEAVSEPVSPEPMPEPTPSEITTSEALVASPTPEEVFAPQGSPGEVSEPVAPQVAPEPSAAPAPQPDEPQEIAALPPPAEPVAPVEREALAPETPEVAVEPDPEGVQEVTPETETDSSDLAVVASPRPRLPERQPTTETAARSDSSTKYSELLSPPLIESPLAAHLRGETDLVVRQNGGGSGFLDSGGSGNSTVTNYAGQVLAHLNRSLTVRGSAQGAAWVFFEINPDGTLAFVRIINSAGVREIDEAAKAQVRKAAPFPRPPKGASRQLTFVYRNN